MIEVLEPILNYIKKDPDKTGLSLKKSIKRIRLVHFNGVLFRWCDRYDWGTS